MSEIEVKIRDDKAMLYTPYNPEFVKRIKKFSDAKVMQQVETVEHIPAVT